jgi:hypothetical protein
VALEISNLGQALGIKELNFFKHRVVGSFFQRHMHCSGLALETFKCLNSCLSFEGCTLSVFIDSYSLMHNIFF